jgi:RimJ/RimL family protein N-acetyltransferase
MPAPNLRLLTARMELRRFVREDAGLLFELDSDPEVVRFVSVEVPTPLAKIQNEILPRILSYNDQTPPRGFWAAQLRHNGQFIGWFHLRPDKFVPEEMELGYRLARSAWGKGLATEGSRELIRLAFEEWGYEKISARTLAENLRSKRVMEKAGLIFEANFVYPPELIPGWPEEKRRAVKYSLLRPARR